MKSMERLFWNSRTSGTKSWSRLSPDDKEDKAKLGSKYCSHHAKRSVIPTENLRRRKHRPAAVNVKLLCNQLQSDGQQPE